MIVKLANLISKFFYSAGFFPPARIVEPTKFVNSIKGKPLDVQEYYLKKMSLYINSTDNSKYYNSLLKALVPEWNKNISTATFLKTKAMGESSLSTFREVNDRNHITFEKIYFLTYLDLKKVQWFQNNIGELIFDEITYPKIINVFSSDTIAITYSDFLSLEIIADESQKMEMMLKFTHIFYRKSIKNTNYLNQLSIPEFILDFQDHFYFKRCLELARQKLASNEINFDFFLNFATQSKHIISHGDIFETNVFANNTLVDWDNFGIYPIGFDIAFIYHRFLVKYPSLFIFKRWLKVNYEKVINTKDWQEFETNVYFFLYIFSAVRFKAGKDFDLEYSLIKRMKMMQNG